jgi:hypothetical protein
MTLHLAELNLARLAAPLDDPQVAEFVAAIPKINALADAAPGFVWRLVDDGGADATSLRPFGADVIVNLSVWESVETLRAYAYKSPHLEYLRRRRAWFVPFGEVNAVNWWVPAGHRPSVEEAAQKLALLRSAGSTQAAFSLRAPHPAPEPAGQST